MSDDDTPQVRVPRLRDPATPGPRPRGVFARDGTAIPMTIFEIGPHDMEFGMGIHGEPGVYRSGLKTADAIADETLSTLLADMPVRPGDRVSVLVNSLGATPLEELSMVDRHVANQLQSKGVTIVMPLVGRYATSMEMTGLSLTLCKLDQELETLLQRPCHCAFWRV
jgi:dihydroxyacetone kinase-like protein